MKFFKNLATHINRYIYRKNSLLYVEIKNETLTLTLFSCKRNTLNIINMTKIKLENSEYIHETIFNPTIIYRYIKKYVHDQELYKPKTLISLPEYEKIPPEKQYMAILQTALCVAKTHVYIEAISKEQLLTNTQPIPITRYLQIQKTDLLIPFKHYNQHSPITWLIRSGILTGILVVILSYIQITKQIKYKHMQKEFDVLNSQTDKLKEKVQALHDIQDEISYFQGKIELINNISHPINNPLKLLLALSRSMPINTFITHLTINPVQIEKTEPSQIIQNKINNPENPKTTPNTKTQEDMPNNIIVTIEGISHDTKEITQLLSNLDKQSNIEDLSITKIKKIKKRLISQPNAASSQYYFKITGLLEK
ncbi:MAG: hypothetical protein ABH827_06360 [bacterium]